MDPGNADVTANVDFSYFRKATRGKGLLHPELLCILSLKSPRKLKGDPVIDVKAQRPENK